MKRLAHGAHQSVLITGASTGFGLETAMTIDAVRLGFRVGERAVEIRPDCAADAAALAAEVERLRAPLKQHDVNGGGR